MVAIPTLLNLMACLSTSTFYVCIFLGVVFLEFIHKFFLSACASSVCAFSRVWFLFFWTARMRFGPVCVGLFSPEAISCAMSSRSSSKAIWSLSTRTLMYLSS